MANNSNPNGTWSFKQGNTLLPYQSTFAPLGGLALPGVASGYAASNHPGDFIPLVGQATGNGPSSTDYISGDVVFHPVDGANGNPSLGQFNIDWTAPTAGTISLSGSIWYAQSPVTRSNDFVLELVRGGSLIQTIETGPFLKRLRSAPIATIGIRCPAAATYQSIPGTRSSSSLNEAPVKASARRMRST